jgi:hypothetical protein
MSIFQSLLLLVIFLRITFFLCLELQATLEWRSLGVSLYSCLSLLFLPFCLWFKAVPLLPHQHNLDARHSQSHTQWVHVISRSLMTVTSQQCCWRHLRPSMEPMWLASGLDTQHLFSGMQLPTPQPLGLQQVICNCSSGDPLCPWRWSTRQLYPQSEGPGLDFHRKLHLDSQSSLPCAHCAQHLSWSTERASCL